MVKYFGSCGEVDQTSKEDSSSWKDLGGEAHFSNKGEELAFGGRFPS